MAMYLTSYDSIIVRMPAVNDDPFVFVVLTSYKFALFRDHAMIRRPRETQPPSYPTRRLFTGNEVPTVRVESVPSPAH